jgi:hypothetical protein
LQPKDGDNLACSRVPYSHRSDFFLKQSETVSSNVNYIADIKLDSDYYQILCSNIYNELGYGAMNSMDSMCMMDHFSVFKVQMIFI